jgi:type VI secretion system protein ImpJ
MPLLEPVIWAKGTFLSPQHLQLQDRFLEETLRFQLQALNFRPWGFTRLVSDIAALSSGTVAIAEAAGIFPDGLLFDIPGSDHAPPQRPVAEHFDRDQTTLDVYLAVPSYRDRGLNIAEARTGSDARYQANLQMIRDENSGQSERPVLFASKNVRLLFEDEDRTNSTSLPIARIQKTAGGLYQLDPKFVPPLLNSAASDYLTSIARRLVELQSAKSAALSASRRQKNQSLADFTLSDIGSFWLLYTINTALPTFRHLFETRSAHPEALYGAMLSLAGALTTFSMTIHVRDFPVYDHDNLGDCFTKLDELLRTLLDTVVPNRFVSLPLKGVRPAIYATSIDQDAYLTNTRCYLAVTAETSKADIIARVPGLVKICSADYIDNLVQNALPGVALTHVTSLPSAIPARMNYQYFSLNQSGGAWEAVVRARNLAAYAPGDFPNPQMELVILLPENQ